VWRFTPGFDLDVEPARLDALPASLRERLLHYGYRDPGLNRFILCCDDARFINHSDALPVSPDHVQDRYGVDIALRDTRAGEEITMDYGLVEGTRP
jgi:hypothetical protein